MSTPIAYSPKQQRFLIAPANAKKTHRNTNTEDDIMARMQRMIELQYEQQQHEQQQQQQDEEEEEQQNKFLPDNHFEQGTWKTSEEVAYANPKKNEEEQDLNEEGVGFGTLLFSAESQQSLTAYYATVGDNSSSDCTPRTVPKTFSYQDACVLSSLTTAATTGGMNQPETTVSKYLSPVPPLTTATVSDNDIINKLQVPVPITAKITTSPVQQQQNHEDVLSSPPKQQFPLHLQQQEPPPQNMLQQTQPQQQQQPKQQQQEQQPRKLPISPHMQHNFHYSNPDNKNSIDNNLNVKSDYYDEFYDKRSYRNYMMQSERNERNNNNYNTITHPSSSNDPVNIAALQAGRSSRQNQNFCCTFLKKCCSLFFRSIVDKCIYMFYFSLSSVCCCFMSSKDTLKQQHQQIYYKSFCYGAIDGMLTGSSIVATFIGMKIFPSNTLFLLFKQPSLLTATTTASSATCLFSIIQIVQLFILLFTITTCFADSICMGLGHIWTTYIMITNNAHQRKKQQLKIQTNKAQVKSRLIHSLLEQCGMLKIDAMSLADTLEGYPDLFINVLVGEPILSHTTTGSSKSTSSGRSSTSITNGTDKEQNPLQGTSISLVPNKNTNTDADNNHYDENTNWVFPSYGGSSSGQPSFTTNDDIDYYDNHNTHNSMLADNEEEDDEKEDLRLAMKESQKEGLFMMLGFTLFAILPSFIQYMLPRLIYHLLVTNTTAAQNDHTAASISVDDFSSEIVMESSSKEGTTPIPIGHGISDFTVIVFLTSIIMWFLGIWKSRFFVLEHNPTTSTNSKYYWLLFGVETVIVLLVCMISAYSVGAFLCYLFPQIQIVSKNLIHALQIIQEQQEQQQ